MGNIVHLSSNDFNNEALLYGFDFDTHVWIHVFVYMHLVLNGFRFFKYIQIVRVFMLNI